MKKAGRNIVIVFLIECAVIVLCTLIDQVVFQVCVWAKCENEISWKLLSIIQKITIPTVGIMFLGSLICKARKNDPAKNTSKKTKAIISTCFRIWRYVLIFLIFLAVLRDRYAGHPSDEFVLSRAHIFLLCINNILIALTGYNLGFTEILKR